ncbi:uncharacterized protein DS421_19g652090 [Arachis hypogaea]|uniref:Uncharacterized protein n=1 Tax=Arachis hypogaea TaxID=3818 RepID=A0A6B9V7J9_ARAHY|nr:uncharacterized protein DS421_19g652090 [Arachis hypogaea]
MAHFIFICTSSAEHCAQDMAKTPRECGSGSKVSWMNLLQLLCNSSALVGCLLELFQEKLMKQLQLQ